MKRRTKRFDEGGEARATQASKGRPEMGSADLGGTGLKRETFGDAFARARRNKEKTFEYNGKKYGTALKGETKAKPAKASSESGVSSSVIDAGIAAAEAQRESRNPNSPRLRSILNVRNRADQTRYDTQAKNIDASDAEQERVAKLQSTGTGRALTDIQAPRITQTMKANQAGADAAKKEFEKRDSMARGAYEGQGYDYDAMKKGGRVKKMASGGTTKSASSRGDGIAQRGKTRGKMC